MMNIGCVVMAAGMSSRFGGNKLAQQWQGKSLIRHALEAVPADRLSAVVVVTQYPEVVALAKRISEKLLHVELTRLMCVQI